MSLIISCQKTDFIDSAAGGQNKIDAAALVRRIIANEIKRENEDHSLWEYQSRAVQGGKTGAYQVVETKSVNLKLKLSENGRPLTADKIEHELKLLQSIARNPSEQKKLRRVNKENIEQAHRLMKMLLPAFIYHVEGIVENEVTVGFYPDPEYHPPTREATVVHTMEGKMILNTQEERLVEIEGHLIRDVKFGFGLLANFKKGGYFLVRQVQVSRNHWKIAEIDVQIHGRALFFKNIGMKQKETHSDFSRLPDNFSIESGISLLRRQLEEGKL